MLMQSHVKEMIDATAHNPLILLEITPVIEKCCDNANVGHPIISAPMAKTQLMQICRQEMFHSGWMQCAGERQNKSVTAKNEPAESFRGMFMRLDDKTPDASAIDAANYKCSKRQEIISGTIQIQPESSDRNSKQEYNSKSIPIFYLKSDDPLCESGVPCLLRGYMFNFCDELDSNDMAVHQRLYTKCSVTSGTSVQILPPVDVETFHRGYARNVLATSLLSNQMDRLVQNTCSNTRRVQLEFQPSDYLPANMYSKLSCYDQENVRALILRMSIMLLNTAWVGTTPNALRFWKSKLPKTMHQQTLQDFFTAQQRYCNDLEYNNEQTLDVTQQLCSSQNTPGLDSVPQLLREGALLLYNSYPNSGKTTLVTTIAKEILKCNEVHIFSAPAIFAKYGTSADAAFETMMHEAVLRGAVQTGSSNESTAARICIVLDHFETFINRGTNIDSYTPILNSMASYLNRLSSSLKNKNEFPFPSSHPLYNNFSKDPSQTPGLALPVGICVIGVMTCADDDENKRQNNNELLRAFDAIGGGRMRLPLPSAATRLSAFRRAFEEMGVELNEEAHQYLSELSVSKTWVYGRSFMDIARRLRSFLEVAGTKVATKMDLQHAFDFLENSQIKRTGGSKSPFVILRSSAGNTTPSHLFGSVGGNKEAKLALEDALALNPRKRHMLSLFGLHPPTGVLLYGPPGTGKTLLARAVAQSISSKDNGSAKHIGGTFISLKASDIVRPEIGNSEKLIVSAFESARVNAPSVVFIDEFQALFGDRDGGGVIVGQLASTLLQCMDDITRWSEAADPSKDDEETDQNSRIVILGATNTPWMIDKAFLRPGRFDRTVHVGLPTLEEREEILRVHSCRMKLAQCENIKSLCESIAKLCLGYSGADIAALCRAAAVRCLTEGSDTEGIRERHYRDAYMHDIVPSSNEELVRRISNWKS